MGQRVELPPGCGGFRCADGTVYRAKPGSAVTLEDNHATALRNSQHHSIGLVTPPSFQLGTKEGRWCVECNRLWQAWSHTCPKCGAFTMIESAMSADPDMTPDPRPFPHPVM
jgi:hypothetical protein